MVRAVGALIDRPGRGLIFYTVGKGTTLASITRKFEGFA